MTQTQFDNKMKEIFGRPGRDGKPIRLEDISARQWTAAGKFVTAFLNRKRP